MASSTLICGTAVNTAIASNPDWANPGNATANDGTEAIVSFTGVNQTSDALDCDNFGFAIPAGATIDGIVLTVEKRESSTATNCRDSSIRLFKAGALEGDDKATATEWPTTLTDVSYGGAADLWGTTWTVDDINHADFGARVVAQVVSAGGSPRVGAVDRVEITVHYTEAAGGDPEGRLVGGKLIRGGLLRGGVLAA